MGLFLLVLLVFLHVCLCFPLSTYVIHTVSENHFKLGTWAVTFLFSRGFGGEALIAFWYYSQFTDLIQIDVELLWGTIFMHAEKRARSGLFLMRLTTMRTIQNLPISVLWRYLLMVVCMGGLVGLSVACASSDRLEGGGNDSAEAHGITATGGERVQTDADIGTDREDADGVRQDSIQQDFTADNGGHDIAENVMTGSYGVDAISCGELPSAEIRTDGPFLNSGHDAFWIARRLTGVAWLRASNRVTATVARDVGAYFDDLEKKLMDVERKSLFALIVCRTVSSLGKILRVPNEELLARRILNECREDELIRMRHYLHVASDFDVAWPNWRDTRKGSISAITERAGKVTDRLDRFIRRVFGARKPRESDFDEEWRIGTRNIMEKFVDPSVQRLQEALDGMEQRYLVVLESQIQDTLRRSGFNIEPLSDEWKNGRGKAKEKDGSA